MPEPPPEPPRQNRAARRAQREREQLAGERSFRMSIVIATLAVTALFLLLLFLRFA